MDTDDDEQLLAHQLKGFHIYNDECELSGDSGEEEYLHYDEDDKENYHYYLAEDLAGKRYARYKANAMKYLVDEEEDSKDKSENEDSDSNGEYLDCNDSD